MDARRHVPPAGSRFNLALQIKVSHEGKETVVFLNGDIDEGFEHAAGEVLSRLTGETLVFDCQHLQRINSIGLAAWSRFVGGLKSPRIKLRHCPSVLIEYCNMVRGIIGRASIESLYVPYYCQSCDREDGILYETAAVSPDKPLSSPPCPTCKAPLRASVDPEEYFAFLGAV